MSSVHLLLRRSPCKPPRWDAVTPQSSRSPAQCSGTSLDKLQNLPAGQGEFFPALEAESHRDFPVVSPREQETGRRDQAMLQLLVVGSVWALWGSVLSAHTLSTGGRICSCWRRAVVAFLREGEEQYMKCKLQELVRPSKCEVTWCTCNERHVFENAH